MYSFLEGTYGVFIEIFNNISIRLTRVKTNYTLLTIRMVNERDSSIELNQYCTVSENSSDHKIDTSQSTDKLTAI